MNRVNWVQMLVVGLVVLLVLLIGASWLGGYGGRGMWSGMMGPGMMGNWNFGSFGWLAMIFMWLLPLGFLILLGVGIAWLFRQASGSSRATGRSTGDPSQTETGQPCPNCGRPVQADWQLCPYCGQKLEQGQARSRAVAVEE